MRDRIISKTLKCIDEVYPEENALNETFYPVEAFLEEAVRWVIDIAPTWRLVEREGLRDSAVEEDWDESGEVYYLKLEDFDGRIVYVKVPSWTRPVFECITENDPRYRQQSNKVLRGNASRPVVALTREDNHLKVELYTIQEGDTPNIEIYGTRYDPENIPESLLDLTAWRLAEVVLMSMNDVQAASVCTAKVNEHIQMLR